MIPFSATTIELKTENNGLVKLVHEYTFSFFGITLYKRKFDCTDLNTSPARTSGFQVFQDQREFVEDDLEQDEQ